METKQAQNPEQDKIVGKKKKKKEKAARLMTFNRGPQRKPVPRASLEDSQELKAKIIDLTNALGNARQSKKGSNLIDKSAFKLSDELCFGLNEVIRRVERRSVIGLIVNDPASAHLEQHLTELCSFQSIPILFVLDFDELKKHFNISRLTAVAFKTNVAKENAKFSIAFKLFTSIAVKFEINVLKSYSAVDKIKAGINDSCQTTVSLTQSGSELDESGNLKLECQTEKNNKDRDNTNIEEKKKSFELPLSQVLYIKETEFKKSFSMRTSRDSVGEQELFLPLAPDCEVYFPTRTVSNFVNTPRVNIINEDDSRREDTSFAESLFDENINTPAITLKRKNPRLDEIQTKPKKLHFAESELVQIQPQGKQKSRKEKRRERMCKKKQLKQ